MTGVAVVLAASAAVAVDVSADDGAIDNAKATHGHDQQQHGGQQGHLAATNNPDDGLDLVSKLALKNVEPGKIADVGVLKNTAYLAAWGGQTCKYNGVHVVDITNVAAPREVAFIQAKEGSYPGEGVQALSLSTAAFTGDILVTNNETCKAGVGFGGINLYDVTNPAHPTPLAVGFGDSTVAGQGKKDANENHSVFAWQAGAKAYAVMVDNEESLDVDIVDISDPSRPVLIKEYDLAAEFPQILQPGQGLDEVFLHDMIVKQIGGRQVMLASYWDAGYVRLDVTDPLNATLIADSDFPDPDSQGLEGTATKDGVQGSPLTVDGTTPVPPEGNAHQAEFAGADNRFVLGADEDFAPFALRGNTDDGGVLDAGQGSDTPPLAAGTTITGQAVFFGRGCASDANPGPGGGRIAVVERGLCTFTEKVASVEKAGGYRAVLIFNRIGSDACDGSLGMSVQGGLPTFGVAPRGQGFAIFDQPYSNSNCLAGTGASAVSPVPIGTFGDTLTFTSFFDGWGYVRLLSATSGAKMAELDTYAIPEAHDPAFATGFGDLSVHEIATSTKNPDVAYVSYYAGGLRVIQVTRQAKIEQRAAFIDQGGNNFWGVQTFTGSDGEEYVAASDRDLGLYIFQYAPVNTAKAKP